MNIFTDGIFRSTEPFKIRTTEKVTIAHCKSYQHPYLVAINTLSIAFIKIIAGSAKVHARDESASFHHTDIALPNSIQWVELISEINYDAPGFYKLRTINSSHEILELECLYLDINYQNVV